MIASTLAALGKDAKGRDQQNQVRARLLSRIVPALKQIISGEGEPVSDGQCHTLLVLMSMAQSQFEGGGLKDRLVQACKDVETVQAEIVGKGKALSDGEFDALRTSIQHVCCTLEGAQAYYSAFLDSGTGNPPL